MMWIATLAVGWLVVAALAVRHAFVGELDPVIAACIFCGFVWGAWQLAREIAEYRRVR